MFAFVCGGEPPKVIRASAAILLASVSAIWQGGCAAGGNTHYAEGPAVAAYVAAVPSAEVEDDGIPSQAAPSRRIRQMPDDPSQPFSRNYGGPNPSVATRAPVENPGAVADPAPGIPTDLPPDFRRQLVAAAGSGV